MSFCIGLSLRSKPLLSLGKAAGILRKARELGDWIIPTTVLLTPLEELRLNRQRLDGAICDLIHKQDLLHAQSFSKPMVEISNVLHECPFPRVHSDDRAIGSMAADYFKDRYLRHAAFFGFLSHNYSDRRQESFSHRLDNHGIRLAGVMDHRTREQLEGGFFLESIGDWLRGLPKPCGVFCSNDARIIQVLQACLLKGIQVPDEIVILGVDTEDGYRAIHDRPYAYIAQDLELIGWEAAGLLDHWLRNGRPAVSLIEVPPKGLVIPEATDLKQEDPKVAKVREWMNSNMSESRTVEEFAAMVGLSRRSLERRFQAQLGHGPKKEQTRLRLERACQMLIGTDRLLADISSELGFAEPRQMTRLFQSEYKLTPNAYRRKMRG
jgi:LacI family transcriptional regulator